MKRDKEWLKDTLNDKRAASKKNFVELVHGRDKSYMNGKNVAFSVALNLIDQLDEPEITEAQAWETLAPRFSMTAKELERQVLDGFLKMTMEEIEMESNKIKQLAVGIKLLHAENEELKAKLEDPGKVVIPQFVADYLETAKKEISLLRVFEIANGLSELDMWRKEYKWIRLYHPDFARAWLDGYEIEKEKLYYVVDEKGQTLLFKAQYRGIIRSNGADLETVLMDFASTPSNMYQVTEKEIKDYDERYWAFAQPVEEEESP